MKKVTLYRVVEQELIVGDLTSSLDYVEFNNPDFIRIENSFEFVPPQYLYDNKNIKIHKLKNNNNEYYVAYDKSIDRFAQEYTVCNPEPIKELRQEIEKLNNKNKKYKKEIIISCTKLIRLQKQMKYIQDLPLFKRLWYVITHSKLYSEPV